MPARGDAHGVGELDGDHWRSATVPVPDGRPPMVLPALTSSDAPVVRDARSETRNETASATTSVAATPPAGVMGVMSISRGGRWNPQTGRPPATPRLRQRRDAAEQIVEQNRLDEGHALDKPPYHGKPIATPGAE